MGTEQNLEILISADASPLRSGMGEAQSATQQATSGMRKSIEDMANASKAAVGEMTAVLRQFSAAAAASSTQVASAMAGVSSAINGLGAKFESLSAEMRRYAQSNADVVDKLGQAKGKAESAAGGFGELGRALKLVTIYELGKQAIEVMSEFEQLQVSLTSVMGSVKEGEKAFAWIKQFAMDTPFQVKDLAQSFRTLKAYGMDPMNGSLKAIVDMASYTGRGLEGLHSAVLGLGQAWTRTKLQGQDILQLVNVGIPVWDILAKATGKNAAELMKMSEKGQLGRDAILALMDGMEKMAGGAAQAQMDTLAGKFSNLKDAVANTLDELRREGALDPLKEGVTQLTGLLQNIKPVFEEVGQTFKAVFQVITDTWDMITGAIASGTGQQITALDVVKGVLEVLRDLFIGIRVAVQIFGEAASAAFVLLGARVQQMANVTNRVLHFDFSGAKQAWKAGARELEQIEQDHFQRMVDIAQKGRDDILKFSAFSPAAAPAGPSTASTGPMTTKKGDDLISKPDNAGKSMMGQYTMELNELKAKFEEVQAAEGTFQQFSLQSELSFWQGKLAAVKKGSDDEKAIRLKIAQDKQKINKDEFDTEVGRLNTEVEYFKNNAEKRVEIELQIAEKVKAAYGAESKEYQQAMKAVVAARADAAKQQEQIDNIRAKSVAMRQEMEITHQQELNQAEYSAGLKTFDQMLAAERQYENELYAIRQKALQDELKLVDPTRNPVQVAQLNAQLEALEMKHTAEMQKIDMKEMQQQTLAWQQLSGTIQNTMTTALQNVLTKTNSIGAAVRNIWRSVGNEFAHIAAQMATTWLMNQVKIRIASMETSLKQINNAALTAAGNAYNAVVGIPYVGPFLAPVAAGVAYAGVMAYGAMASAEGGYDIPAGVNPVTQLHEKEMVLPRAQAEVIRSLADDGGSSGNVNVTIQAHPMPGNWFMVHQDQLAAAIKTLHRNNAFRT